MAVIIDTSTLLKVVASALLAGVGVSAVFALAVYGATRANDMRRLERRGAAGAFAALAVVGLAMAAGLAAYGIVLTTQKS